MSHLFPYLGATSMNPRIPNFALDAFEDYTMEALNGVIDQVPEWHTLLDNLNSQIALRQFELAELDGDRPPARSLKPKGSTESLLRPKNLEEPILEDENTIVATETSPKPLLTKNTVFPNSHSPQNTLQGFVPTSPRKFQSSSTPVTPLQRRTSARLNSANLSSTPNTPTSQRPRKTESLASGESKAPKFRTRSMIIVYYDSAVQLAFEELVKLISVSRNAMRKGKMAARMAEMKRLAEMETGSDEDEKDDITALKPHGLRNGSAVCAYKRPLEADEGGDEETPKLQFVSTRRMGPSRDSPTGAAANLRNRASNTTLSPATRRMIIPGYKGNPVVRESGSFGSIFDELDTGLEWCQSMCEHAAHQFLRDGTCDTEIVGIKKRLWEVREVAEREKVKVMEEEKEQRKRKEEMARHKKQEAEQRLKEASRPAQPPQLRPELSESSCSPFASDISSPPSSTTTDPPVLLAPPLEDHAEASAREQMYTFSSYRRANEDSNRMLRSIHVQKSMFTTDTVLSVNAGAAAVEPDKSVTTVVMAGNLQVEPIEVDDNYEEPILPPITWRRAGERVTCISGGRGERGLG